MIDPVLKCDDLDVKKLKGIDSILGWWKVTNGRSDEEFLHILIGKLLNEIGRHKIHPELFNELAEGLKKSYMDIFSYYNQEKND